MKKILIISLLAALGLSSFCQSGTGWINIKAKQNFRDTTNFVKPFRIGNIPVTFNAAEGNILDGALVTTSELNRIVGLRSNVQDQLDDTLTLALDIMAQTASYTLALTDAYNLVTVNSASENTVTVPPNTSVAFETGAYVKVASIGEGSTSIAAGAGVTVNAPNDELGLVRYEVATLYKIATNNWLLEKTAVDTTSSTPPAGSSSCDGLIAYWKFDEASGNAVDSYSTYDGTCSNITYGVAGAINNGYTFNGTSSNVAFGDVINPTTGLSVSFWLKSSTGGGTLIDHLGNDGAYKGFQLDWTADGSINLMVGSGNNANFFDQSFGAGALDNGVLHHVAITFDGSNFYIYIDNVKSSPQSWPYTITYLATSSLNIGSNGGGTGFYNGFIDEPCIYDRPLTDAEVALLYAKTPYSCE